MAIMATGENSVSEIYMVNLATGERTKLGGFPISRVGINLFDSFKKVKPELPERYIINEHVCVCHWKDGTVTKSFRHESDKFNKELGFLLCCFRHYNADKSNNKLKKMISWIKYENLEEYLFDMFIEKNNMKVGEAKAYLRDLKIEEPKEEKRKQFKVGDKVVLRKDLKDCETYGKQIFIESRMGHFKGKTVTISRVVTDDCYVLEEDEEKFYYSKEMFEEARKPKHMKEEK